MSAALPPSPAPERLVYDGPWSGLMPAMELRAWRLFGAQLMPLLEEALAAQGEAPDERILSLQHSLAELLRSPANTSGAQSSAL